MGFRKFAKKFGRKAAKKLNPLTKLKKLGGKFGLVKSKGGGGGGEGPEAPRASAAKLMRRQAGIGQVTTLHQEE